MHAPADNSLKFQRIKQHLLNSPTYSANDAKFTPFIDPLYIMFQMPDHRQRTLRNSSESSEIRSIHPQIPQITRISHLSHKNSSTFSSLFSEPSTENSRKLERLNQISRSSPTAPANYAKFAESAPMTSKLGVNPENSRNIQRTTQVLHLSQNTSANHAKFATFVNKTQDKFPFLAHFAHVLLHIFRIYAHILHYCRLALNTCISYHVNRILR